MANDAASEDRAAPPPQTESFRSRRHVEKALAAGIEGLIVSTPQSRVQLVLRANASERGASVRRTKPLRAPPTALWAKHVERRHATRSIGDVECYSGTTLTRRSGGAMLVPLYKGLRSTAALLPSIKSEVLAVHAKRRFTNIAAAIGAGLAATSPLSPTPPALSDADFFTPPHRRGPGVIKSKVPRRGLYARGGFGNPWAALSTIGPGKRERTKSPDPEIIGSGRQFLRSLAMAPQRRCATSCAPRRSPPELSSKLFSNEGGKSSCSTVRKCAPNPSPVREERARAENISASSQQSPPFSSMSTLLPFWGWGGGWGGWGWFFFFFFGVFFFFWGVTRQLPRHPPEHRGDAECAGSTGNDRRLRRTAR